MVIHDFYVVGIILGPFETNPPLIVDADTVLPCTITLQSFQAIGGWSAQVLQYVGFVQIEQLAAGGLLDIWWEFAGNLAFENLLRFLVGKTLYHALNITCADNIVKR